MGGLDAGIRYEARLGALVPFAAIGLVHQHEVSVDHASQAPLWALAGVAEAIGHRTGGAAALGLALRPGSLPLTATLRASASLLIPRAQAPTTTTTIGLSLGLGWRW